MLAFGVALGSEEKSAENLECPVGERDGVVLLDIGGRLLVNGGEVGLRGTIIILAVPEQHALSGALELKFERGLDGGLLPAGRQIAGCHLVF